LLCFKYSPGSLGTIYIFTAFPSASFPLMMRFTLFGCPAMATDLYSGRCHFMHLSQQKPKGDAERCPRSALNATGRRAGAFAALSAVCTWVMLGRTICQMHQETCWVKGPFCLAGRSQDGNTCSIPGVTSQCPWHR